jgi:hypothetical protein
MEAGANFLDDIRSNTYKTIPCEYTLTAHSETVDGHSCRIWTETENGATRLELCVTDVSAVPGGDEILPVGVLLDIPKDYQQQGSSNDTPSTPQFH